MISFWLFILSGVALVGLTLAKRIELKSKKGPSFILRLVSRGDERIRRYYHDVLHFYSEGKHRFFFFVRKQLPLKAKSYVNKSVSYVKEKGESRFGNMRNSRTIKRPENISEFFKNISEIEKGNGELHDDIVVIRDEPQVSVLKEEIPVAEPIIALEALERVQEEVIVAPKPRKPRVPRKKKEVVIVEPVIEVSEIAESAPVVEPIIEEPAIEFIPTRPENFKAVPKKRKVKVVEVVE